MIDSHKEIVAALSAILPTHYEATLTADTDVPCISYMEYSNRDELAGETLGYSVVAYQVKVWGTNLGLIQTYAKRVDSAVRALGFTRTGSAEVYDRLSNMIQKVLIYEAVGFEHYYD